MTIRRRQLASPTSILEIEAKHPLVEIGTDNVLLAPSYGPHQITLAALSGSECVATRVGVVQGLLGLRKVNMREPRKITVGTHTVAVWEYGDPDGSAVFVFHGVPACGAGFEWVDVPATERGLRLLAPDRPGIGRSSSAAAWRIAEYPAMVEALADAMKIDSCVAWGYSGGGPYAAAVAAHASARVRAVAISAGMGEIRDGWANVDDFERTDAQFLRMSGRHPWRARALMRVAAIGARVAPAAARKSFAQQLSPTDLAVMGSLGPPREAMRLFTEAVKSSARGVVADYAALAQPWDVDFASTRVPVSIWQGTDDPMVPAGHAVEYAERIPTATLTLWPGEGHLATVTHVGEILDWLASYVDR